MRAVEKLFVKIFPDLSAVYIISQPAEATVSITCQSPPFHSQSVSHYNTKHFNIFQRVYNMFLCLNSYIIQAEILKCLSTMYLYNCTMYVHFTSQIRKFHQKIYYHIVGVKGTVTQQVWFFNR